MKKRIVIAVLTLVVGMASVSYAFFGSGKKTTEWVKSLWVESTPQEQAQNRIELPSFAPLVKKVEPAVLVVTTEAVVKQEQQIPPELRNSPFKDFFHFFGPQGPQEHKTRGQGSGFMIHPSGLALSNYHVVEGATSIKVKVGRSAVSYDAEIVGSDPATDVALLRIKSDRKDWPVIPLGSSDSVQVGDWGLAIGNPLGLELSASVGIISARGRRDIHPSGRNGLYDFMQFSGAINPGNSGGPLLSLTGEVIGINTAISASGQGIAFAIPIDQVKRILPQLEKNGTVSRSWLGVQIQEVTPELASAIGLKESQGALVREVVPESPAKKAGLEPGDIVVEFEGKPVETAGSLQVMAGLAGVGKQVVLKVFRDGKPIYVNLKLEEMPKEKKDEKEPAVPKSSSTAVDDLGVSVVTLDGKLKSQLKVDPKVDGVVVTSVDPRSISMMAGIEVNDVIIKLNNTLVKNAEGFASAIKAIPAGGVLRMLIVRGNSTYFVAINKP